MESITIVIKERECPSPPSEQEDALKMEYNIKEFISQINLQTSINNLETIVAKTIDLDNFTYECSRCWSKYKKNGEPAARAKHIVHTHGSDKDLTNRKEYRIAQCINKKRPIIIHITDETKRI
jgi:hypothetical protein